MFPTGTRVMTRGFLDMFDHELFAASTADELVRRHVAGDWGDLCEEDRQANVDALKNGDRVFSCYNVKGEKIYVITEADRSVTTVLLPSEY